MLIVQHFYSSGSDPAPFLANLFLLTYESSWLLKSKESDLQKAGKFGSQVTFVL